MTLYALNGRIYFLNHMSKYKNIYGIRFNLLMQIENSHMTLYALYGKIYFLIDH